MNNLITTFKIFNPIFLIKLGNLNYLIRRLRKSGEFSIQYMDLSKEPVLFITVTDDAWLLNTGISNSIIKNINRQIVHEAFVQGVVLRWHVYRHITLLMTVRPAHRRQTAAQYLNEAYQSVSESEVF